MYSPMRPPPSSSRHAAKLHWPLLVAPLLNGAAHALRPALTAADRLRWRVAMPALDGIALDARAHGARLLRADLVESKLRGGIVGAVAVVGCGRRIVAALRVLSMHDMPPLRAEVARMLTREYPHIEGLEDAPSIASDALALQRQLSIECGSALGVPDSYAADHGLAWIDEPPRLHYAGRDYVGRTLWLAHGTVHAWQSMRRAAAEAGVALEAISGFRSIGYQAALLRRKLDRGMSIGEVLAINTAPGYSEHHSGRAIDIGTPGVAPAEEVFETTPAFAWLRQHAARFGFRMSYPRDNPHGVIYEPWHYLHGVT
jgi:hypothetical protein